MQPVAGIAAAEIAAAAVEKRGCGMNLLLLLRKHSLQQQFARHAGKFGQSGSNKNVSFSLQS
jgi:hypothetical protein